jgi:hypothetical protein
LFRPFPLPLSVPPYLPFPPVVPLHEALNLFLSPPLRTCLAQVKECLNSTPGSDVFNHLEEDPWQPEAELARVKPLIDTDVLGVTNDDIDIRLGVLFKLKSWSSSVWSSASSQWRQVQDGRLVVVVRPPVSPLHVFVSC